MTHHCGQGSLACCSPWGCKESDMTEWLNWTEPFVNLSVHQFTYQISLEQDRTAYYMTTNSKRLFNDITFITCLWLLPSCCYWHSSSFYGGPATCGDVEPWLFCTWNPLCSTSAIAGLIFQGASELLQVLVQNSDFWVPSWRLIQ